MTKFIAIASGKGGTGKTSVAINLATALNQFGREVLVVDGHFRSPHIALHLGASTTKNSFHEVLTGKKKMKESAYKHISGIKIIPGSISPENQKNINSDKIKKSLQELIGTCEVVILDTGTDELSEDVIKVSDEMIIVTNPNILAVTEALKTIKKAEEMGVNVSGIVVNRVRDENSEMSLSNIEIMLDRQVIGVIPEDKNVREALVMKHPVVYSHPRTIATVAFKQLASKFIGEEYKEKL